MSMKTKVILFSSKHRGDCFLCNCGSLAFAIEVWNVMILVLKDNVDKKILCTLHVHTYMLMS